VMATGQLARLRSGGTMVRFCCGTIITIPRSRLRLETQRLDSCLI
jgi:hypothetical protein